MNLTDAGLRARAVTECPNAERHQTGAGCTICFVYGERYIALRDAARAEQREVIRGLMKACDELMTEFASKHRAANWGVINDAMMAGAAAIRAQGREE